MQATTRQSSPPGNWRFTMICRFLTILAALSLLVLAACEHSTSTAAPDHVKAVKAVVEQAADYINSRNYAALKDVIADDYRRHSQATPDIEVTSLEQFVTFLKQGAIAFPDDRVILDILVTEGDLVAFWGRYEGTNTGPGPFPPTGKSVSIEMAGIHRIENGKIAETWVTWDNRVMFSQLGIVMVPAPFTVELPGTSRTTEEAAKNNKNRNSKDS